MAWKKTTCGLCGNGCGLEVQVENNRIIKARGDKDNPLSEGYICRKGVNIAYHLHNADRVLYPLKRTEDGFERISWDQAIDEISAKLKDILEQHGPRSLASVVGGGEMGFGLKGADLQEFIGGVGSQYFYSSGNQEFAGRYWAHGLTLGSQAMAFMTDHENTDMMLLIGKNPLQSHNMQQPRKRLLAMAKDPDRLLVVVDPRQSETAKIANIHLAIRPGRDALLLKSMIAIILSEELQNQAYIAEHTRGFSQIMSWFAGFDVRAALEVCELEYDQVVEVARQFATRRSCLHDDLGVLMGRHSALVSYLLVVLLAICGRKGMPGGNYAHGGGRSGGDFEDAWRTLATDIPALNGMFPPNVMPEEIMSDHPERLRAVFTFACNPLRSYADTVAYEEAFRGLDLLVVTEMVMSETAALAHYILPSKSDYESWTGQLMLDGSTVYGRTPGPVVEAEGEQKEGAEVFALLADAMGLIPELPESLYQTAASGDLRQFGDALKEHLEKNPENNAVLGFITAKTLGHAIGSAQRASQFTFFWRWGQIPEMAEMISPNGFTMGPNLDLDMYQATIDHPEGVPVLILNQEASLYQLPTEGSRVQLHCQEVEDWIKEIDPATERERLIPDAEFPLILMAGRHMSMNANSSMRDPAWNEGRRPCTLAMNPADAEGLGLSDGKMVKITTEAGEEPIELEVTDAARRGQVIIPHGFGLVYDGVKHGVNVNRLTKNTHRDQFGTPIHRYVPCRVEAL